MAAGWSSPGFDPMTLLDALPNPVIATDLDGVVRFWSASAERVFGWTAEETVGRPISEITVPDQGQELAAEIMAELRAGRSWSGGFTVRRKDGSTFPALVSDAGLCDERGRLVGIVGVSVNLGEALRPLLARSTDAAVVVARTGVLRWCTPAVTGVLGWGEQELTGRTVRTLVHPDDWDSLLSWSRELMTQPGPHTPVELRVRRRDGSWTWVEAVFTNLLDDPVVRGVVCNLRDISERRAASQRLTRLALHDPLTGLANRALVADRLEHALARRGRSGALLFVDLDQFKAVNDAYGHTAGDELLRVVAARLRGTVRPEDTCGRLGGDEFILLAESVSDAAEAVALAERIVVALDAPVGIGPVELVPRASIGVTMLSGGASSADEVIHQADVAMYRAKLQGHGRYAVYRPDSMAEGWDRATLVAQLPGAFRRGELAVFFQPLVRLPGEQLVGVEALVRWHHPRRGLLAAGEFVDLAETGEVAEEIDGWVLREACQQVARWRPEAPRLRLAVNVASSHLIGGHLVALVRSALTAAQLPATALELEVTEEAVLRDLPMATETLDAVRQLGCRVAVDDFGTGYAGLDWLPRLPVDKVKVDGSFVQGIGRRAGDAALVDGIVHLAHGLGLRVVAEQVQTVEQALALVRLGCDGAQGYLWGPPEPARVAVPAPPRRLPAPVAAG